MKQGFILDYIYSLYLQIIYYIDLQIVILIYSLQKDLDLCCHLVLEHITGPGFCLISGVQKMCITLAGFKPLFSYVCKWWYHPHKCVCAHSHLTSWDSMDCSPPGSSLHGTSQARTRGRVVISYSRLCSQSKDRAHVSCDSHISRQNLDL